MNKSEICNSFCFVFFSEKLRLGRRTAASCRDEALYTNRSGFCSLTPQRRFFQQDPTRRSLMTSQKNSSHSFFFFFFAPVCRRVPLSPSAGSIICRPHPTVHQVIICGSQDCPATWGRHCKMTGGPDGV